MNTTGVGNTTNIIDKEFSGNRTNYAINTSETIKAGAVIPEADGIRYQHRVWNSYLYSAACPGWQDLKRGITGDRRIKRKYLGRRGATPPLLSITDII
ncbi:MAG: hypothetical protein IPP42_24815 [Saprospiraceae bacterium]|nr:hypothetical protein [Saprospiraceae bacterium]